MGTVIVYDFRFICLPGNYNKYYLHDFVHFDQIINMNILKFCYVSKLSILNYSLSYSAAVLRHAAWY